jgi:hypothetical protein
MSALVSGVPRIGFSSFSVIGGVLASRVVYFLHWYHVCVPSKPAFGGDDHRCSEEKDHSAEDQESCCVGRRHHIGAELAIEASKLAWKIATSSTLLPVRL